MRRDIFLHFLNRDTREVFNFGVLQDRDHRRVVSRALNASVVLCEDRCIAPPGFVVEDAIAFDLAELQRAYLKARVIQFPLRENNLAEFAEKKRVGYEPMRSRYSGLFDDDRIGFLGQHAQGLIRRKSKITEKILDGWRSGPEAGHRAWKAVKGLLRPSEIDRIARIPIALNDRGTALTWAAISPELPECSSDVRMELRNVLQHTYFSQYCAEFGLVVLKGIPYIIHDFGLPVRSKSYDLPRFAKFLSAFGLENIVLGAPAELIVDLRRRDGFISFIDAYVALAETKHAATDTGLSFAAGHAARQTRIDWPRLERRRPDLFELSPVEILELDDMLRQAASTLADAYGLPTRGTARTVAIAIDAAVTKTDRSPIVVETPEADVTLFVALEEELDVLVDELKLRKSHLSPAAKGRVGGIDVDVVCPKEMGRVPAAVAVATYMAKRRTRPKLLLIVGLAGGFQEGGTQVGHTLGVTTVVDLAHRKVQDDASGGTTQRFRRRDFTLRSAVNDVLTSDSFDRQAWSDDATKRFDWPPDRRPSIHKGPVASVDEVVSSDDWRERLLSGHDKLLGVEMEAGGVCAAVDRDGVPVCMLRIVSDNADPSKADDQWRRRGMRTLASLLSRLPFDSVFEALQV